MGLVRHIIYLVWFLVGLTAPKFFSVGKKISISPEKLQIQKVSFSKLFYSVISVLILFSFLPDYSAATVYTWDGGGGDNTWETGANWNPDAPAGGPAAGDSAAIDSNVTVTISGTTTVSKLTIGGTNTATLNLQGNSLNVTYVDATYNGNLTIGTNGTLDASTGTPTITVEGDWNSSGGTFSQVDNSTVVMGRNGNSNTILTSPSVFFEFYNLTINAGSTISVDASDTNGFQINGFVTISGTFSIPSNITVTARWYNDLTINTGGELTGQGTYSRDVDATTTHIVNNGTISINTFRYRVRTWDVINNPQPITATTYGNNLEIKNLGSWDWSAYVGCATEPACPNLVVNGTLKIYHDRDGKTLTVDPRYNIPVVIAGNLIIGDSTLVGCAKFILGNSTTVNGNITVYKELETTPSPDCSNIIDATVGTPTINVTGSVTNNDTITAGSSTWNAGGNWNSSSGTFNYGASTVNLTGSGTLNVNTGGYFYNLSMAANAKTTTLQSNINVANVCTLGAGTLTGSYTIFLTASSGKPLVNNGASISINMVRYEPTGSGTITIDGGNYGTATNITFYRAGVQSTTFNLEDALTVAGTFYIVVTNLNGALTFNTQGNALNATALQLAKEDSGTGPTVNFGASTVNLGTGGLAVSNWGYGAVHTLNLGSSIVNCAGPWKLVDGPDRITQNPGASTVNLNGTNQTISGSGTFYNLTKTVTTAATLTFQNSKEQTITNALTFQGASGQLLSLRSDSPSTQYKITLQAGKSQTLSYLDVQDSDASGGQTLGAGPYSTNSGNNSNWTFKIISIVLRDASDTSDYPTWSIGSGKTTDMAYIMDAGNAVLIKNDGNVSEDFSIQATGTNWTLGSATGVDTCVLMGLFNGNTAPAEGDYNVTYDVITGTTIWATQSSGNGKFEGINDGDTVASGTGEKLYIYLKTPSSLTNGNQETITVTIGVREH